MDLVIIDAARRQEIAALVKAGYPVEKIAAKTGLSGREIGNIASRFTVKTRATATRRLDVKAALTGALSIRKALQHDGAPSITAALHDVISTRDESDPSGLGLERHVMVAWMRGNRLATIDSMLRVGVEDAWTSIDMVAGRYVFPRDNPCTEHLRSEIGWGRLSWYLDLVVEYMAQAINPSALVLLGDKMDWGLWRLRAEYMVRHPEVVENFDSWKSRVEIISPRSTREGALDASNPNTKAPWIIFSRKFIAERLSRFVMLLLDPPSNATERIGVLANAFPMATWYSGNAITYHGQGKQDTMPVAVIDALVPANMIQLLVEHAGAVASLVTPTCIVMPEARSIDIPYPEDYPVHDIGAIFSRDARRASAMPEQRILSLAEQWDAQQRLNGEVNG